MQKAPPEGGEALIEKPKRRWFQFHLSTAVLLTIVTSPAQPNGKNSIARHTPYNRI